MEISAPNRLQRMLRILSQIGAVGAAAIGLVVLSGWTFGIEPLKSLNPGWVTMKPNTALGFVFCGAALWLGQECTPSPRRRWLAIALALVVGLMALATLAEFAWGLDLHIDQILFIDDPNAVNTAFPGRMALRTALLYLAMAVGLLPVLIGLRGRWRYRLQQAMAVGVILFALGGVVMYLFGAEPATGRVNYTPIAYHTAVAFILLGLSLLFLRPNDGPARIFSDPGIGGMLVRRTIPVAILLPTIAGYLHYLADAHNLVDSATGEIYSTLLFITVLSILLLFFAHLISRQERQRQAAEDIRDRFFSTAQDMLCVAGFDGYFKRVNPAFEKVLGYTAAELTSRPYLEFVHPDDRTVTHQETGKYPLNAPTLHFQNRYICKDGRIRNFSWTATPVPETQLVYASARDVTDELRALNAIADLNAELADRLQALELANKELESFSYSVSHDLRAPLRHIDGYVEMLREDLAAGDMATTQARMDSISRSVRNMGRLIDELLEFSRMARAEMKQEPCDLQALVNELIARFSAEAGARVIRWQRDSLPVVMGDPVLLQQVWTNLLENAVKYSRPRAETVITIGVTRNAGELAFSIGDNGVGFDSRFAHKLFGVFQRLHSIREFEGTGIGLAIVQRIVERHGGKVWAEGQPGVGATFHFSLPVTREVLPMPALLDALTSATLEKTPDPAYNPEDSAPDAV